MMLLLSVSCLCDSSSHAHCDLSEYFYWEAVSFFQEEFASDFSLFKPNALVINVYVTYSEENNNGLRPSVNYLVD